ncbi:CPBP family intramembrane metalloprotease [Staphylococcus capitis]|uniref:CPBP family intramembrane glutamic endopeptidase n=9 Tax=Staphylococcus capitis TaxID=29388 RepID=UPI000D19E9B2|nr:type II CAAX endopeptidase family protein [Staphylococcus capitis]PTG24732.1 CPBP family intramembrane metalloprotease [Staphylococcus capitis]PTG30185.1 CPBP family intramembrane metalloprotease [Staphylococcus capitis]PTH07734.1 CPBP family intramembrane metalloprotease [Staphylococcus capitis]PTH12936.1 CPBP family intramembrane metalloprotease [Staphylococcus capitis]PTH20848.1 CPBP family intramembrane metalloprotease [Staphylococcus capitis]
MSHYKTNYNLSNKKYGKLLFQSLLISILLFIGEGLLMTFISKPLFYGIGIIYILLIFIICKFLKLKVFNFSMIKFTDFLLVVLSFILIQLLNVFFLQNVPSVSNQNYLEQMVSNSSIGLIILTIGIIIPVIEECVLRAFVIKGIFRGLPFLGSIVSVILFTIMHGPTNIWEYLIFGSSGIIYVFTFLKTQRLEVPILIHILNNSYGIIQDYFF